MDKLMYRVGEVGELLGLGRSKAYEMIQTGELPSVRIGRSVRVPAQALRQWVEEQVRASVGSSAELPTAGR